MDIHPIGHPANFNCQPNVVGETGPKEKEISPPTSRRKSDIDAGSTLINSIGIGVLILQILRGAEHPRASLGVAESHRRRIPAGPGSMVGDRCRYVGPMM